MEINVNTANFKKEVIDSEIPALVDFWAPWCGPCQMIAPQIEELAKAYSGKLKVCKLNVDQAPEVATQYTVMSIPAVMLFKAGNVMGTRVGVMNKKELEKFIRPYL